VLQRAVKDNLFDTVMGRLQFTESDGRENRLSAMRCPQCWRIDHDSCAQTLSRVEALEKTIADLKKRRTIPEDALPDKNPLGWLVKNSVESVTAAAYKFAAAPEAVSTVITGTSKLSHLRSNIDAILGSPLATEDMARLNDIFGHMSESLGN